MIFVDDWSKLQPVRLGLAIALEMRRTHANDWQSDRFDRLLIHKATFDATWREELQRFGERRKKWLGYE